MTKERIERLERKIGRRVARLNSNFNLIGEGDRVLVAVSGGKDSLVLLHMLIRLKKIAPFSFDMVACHLDQGQPNFPVETVERAIAAFGVPYVILHRNTYEVVQAILKPNETRCALCSRLRRGILYSYAADNNFSKIALGHHSDDLVETLLLNLFFSGQIKSMPPKLVSNDRRNTVIRPLALIPEEWIREMADLLELPIVPCSFCSQQENLERQNMKELLQTLMKRNPKVKSNILGAISNVQVSHLMDVKLTELYERGGEQAVYDEWIE